MAMATFESELGEFAKGLTAELTGSAVRYAVSKAMFCPDCGRVLDTPRSVLVTTSKAAGISCEDCFYTLIDTTAQNLKMTRREVLRLVAESTDYGSAALALRVASWAPKAVS